MMDANSQWQYMGQQRFDNMYGVGTFSAMSSLHNFRNALNNSSYYHFTGAAAQTLFGMMKTANKDGFNIYGVEAFGRLTIVSSLGDIGSTEFGQNGGIGFSNPTASAFMSAVEATNGGGELNTANNIAGGVGALGTGLGMFDGTFRLTKSGSFSPGYYSSGWNTGNQYVKNLYSVSKVGKGLSTGASVVTTGMAYYQIANGTQQPITYADATVGTIGLSATIASYYIGIAIPYVGEFVAIYGTARLFWDLGQDYGPRTWYGKNDYKYFK